MRCGPKPHNLRAQIHRPVVTIASTMVERNLNRQYPIVTLQRITVPLKRYRSKVPTRPQGEARAIRVRANV
jgi:hypothetical protein